MKASCAVCGCRLPAGVLAWRADGLTFCFRRSPHLEQHGQNRLAAAKTAAAAGYPSVWAMVAAHPRPRPAADAGHVSEVAHVA